MAGVDLGRGGPKFLERVDDSTHTPGPSNHRSGAIARTEEGEEFSLTTAGTIILESPITSVERDYRDSRWLWETPSVKSNERRERSVSRWVLDGRREGDTLPIRVDHDVESGSR